MQAAAVGELPALLQLAEHTLAELKRATQTLRRKCDEAQAHKRFLQHQMKLTLGGGEQQDQRQNQDQQQNQQQDQQQQNGTGVFAEGGDPSAAGTSAAAASAGGTAAEPVTDQAPAGPISTAPAAAAAPGPAAATAPAPAAGGSSAGTDGKQCSVCLEVITDHMMLYACGHYYCERCTAQLFEAPHPSCPFCRHKISKGSVFRVCVKSKKPRQVGAALATCLADVGLALGTPLLWACMEVCAV